MLARGGRVRKEAEGMLPPFQILTETSSLEHSGFTQVSGLPRTFSTSLANLLAKCISTSPLVILALPHPKKKKKKVHSNSG